MRDALHPVKAYKVERHQKLLVVNQCFDIHRKKSFYFSIKLFLGNSLHGHVRIDVLLKREHIDFSALGHKGKSKFRAREGFSGQESG